LWEVENLINEFSYRSLTGVRSGNLPIIQHLVKQSRARALQPQPRLRQDVRREDEVRVDAQGGLVVSQVRVRVSVSVAHLRLGRDGQELVRPAQESGLRGVYTCPVGEHDGRVWVVQDAEGVDEGW
jgi:hypothetical protein